MVLAVSDQCRLQSILQPFSMPDVITKDYKIASPLLASISEAFQTVWGVIKRIHVNIKGKHSDDTSKIAGNFKVPLLYQPIGMTIKTV